MHEVRPERLRFTAPTSSSRDRRRPEARVPRLGTRHPTEMAGSLAEGVRFGSALGRGRVDDTAGSARPRRRRSSTAALPPSGRRTSSTSTRASSGASRRHAAPSPRGSDPAGAASTGERLDRERAWVGAALPLGGRGGLRHPRGRRHAPPLASPSIAARTGAPDGFVRPGHVIARPPATRAATVRAGATAYDAHLRHATTERHVLVPPARQDRVSAASAYRPLRGARRFDGEPTLRSSCRLRERPLT